MRRVLQVLAGFCTAANIKPPTTCQETIAGTANKAISDKNLNKKDGKDVNRKL